MSLFAWSSRRAGIISHVALVTLCCWVICQAPILQRHGFKHELPGTKSTTYSSTFTSATGFFLQAFAWICLFIHINVVLVAIRAILGGWQLTQTMSRSSHNQYMKAYTKAASNRRRRASLTSLSSSETPVSEYTAVSSANSDAGDTELDIYTDGDDLTPELVIHAIVIPNYKEEVDTLKETLEVLASHTRAQSAYDIYLGMEQREVNGESKALALVQELVKKFRSIDVTVHPGDIPGEAAGKGSNMAWAARKLSAKYSMAVRKDVIVTSIDADSHLSSSYFNIIANMHLSYPETARTSMYATPIVFDRNAHKVASLVRVADIAWSAAGMSGLYHGSAIAPPTSVYSLPLELVDRAGGWDADAEAIGEDLHMYIKCFFALNGNLTCRVVPSPVSQSNVSGNGGKGVRGVHSDILARYKQAIRHMWGALDSGYAMRMLAAMWRERKHTSRTFRPLHLQHGDNSDSYVPMIQSNGDNSIETGENGIFSDITHVTLQEPHWENIFYLGHRLFEAHFLPVHMTIMVLATAAYAHVMEGQEDSYNLAWIFQACNILRVLGLAMVLCFLAIYDFYHHLAVNAREREMTDAGLAKGMSFSKRSLKKNFQDYALIPVVAPLYGAIPLVQAEVSHIWTQELVYTVSKKATRERSKCLVPADMA